MSNSYYVDLESKHNSWKDGLLVLMYHSVDAPPIFYGMRGLYVTPGHLKRQLSELKAATHIGRPTLSEWNSAHPPGRQVIVTFDDAYLSLFEKGLPILQETGVHAINYVVADKIGKINDWAHGGRSRVEKLMDRSQIDEWLAAGHEIGAHTMTHPHLAQIPLDEARREIVDSKKKLEDLFGRPVPHFCYPYGSWNQAVRDIVEEAGYETATSTIEGFSDATTDRFALLRYLAGHRKPYLAAIGLG